MNEIRKELLKFASKERKKSNEWFFKMEKGEYGEHDRFLGVSGLSVRLVAKKFADASYGDLKKSLSSEYNEERSCVLIILVNKYKKKQTTEEEREKIYKFFMENLKYINNWNLVDVSIPHVVGEYIADHRKKMRILDELSLSHFHWHRRISILATWAFIKRENLQPTLKIAKKLLGDKEDLMHKAVGWMLREAWKKEPQKVEDFLQKNYEKISRTTLRYAIERMEETKRRNYLSGDF